MGLISAYRERRKKKQAEFIVKTKAEYSYMYTTEFSQNADKEDIPGFLAPFRADTNIETVYQANVVRCYKKDRYIERLLDSGKYTFSHPLIIFNPFFLSPLSAIILFNTETPVRVSYKVFGRDGADDLNLECHVLSTRQRVPVVGLYPGCTTTILFTLFDENGKKAGEKYCYLRARNVSDYAANVRVENFRKIRDGSDLLMVTGGYSQLSYGFDKAGNIRYAMARPTYQYGLHPLGNSQFLYAEHAMKRPIYGNAHSNVMHVTDLMGRYSKTIYHPYGFHHWGGRQPGGRLMITSSSIADGYGENMILEIDPDSGEVVRSIEVNDLFDDTYKTRHDWAHINSFHYLEDEDAYLVSMRNIHTIAKIQFIDEKPRLVWIFANPAFYRRTEQKDKVLDPDDNVCWFFQQHGLKLLDRDREKGLYKIMIFDNHTANRRPVSWFDKKKESYVCTYLINEKEHSVKMLDRIPTELSITRSNAEITPNGKYLQAMCANPEQTTETDRAQVNEYSLKDGSHVKRFICDKDYFAGFELKFDLDKMASPLAPPENFSLFGGHMRQPFHLNAMPGEYDPATAEDLELKDSDIRYIRIIYDLLQISCYDHDLEKIYLYNDADVYEMDYTDTVQETKIFKNSKYFVSMQLTHLKKGRYKIVLRYKGHFIKTKYWIEITDPVEPLITD